jgi:UDP-N-acetylglucosamine 2-epimerase (non-hydrolysing)
MSLRVMNVVGARPNFMKAAPVLAEWARASDVESILVHTGQHYDDRMSSSFFEQLGIRDADYNLGVGSGTQTTQTAQIMTALEPLVATRRPDLVVVFGDVNSTLAAALVASKAGVPIAHVEAGLRSFDRTMPEEINRIVTDALSSFLFTTEPQANENLRREGIPEANVFYVGNVMIDTLMQQLAHARSLGMPARHGVAAGDYAILTLHRPSNVDSLAALESVLNTCCELSRSIDILFPVHPRTQQMLQGTELQKKIAAWPRLTLLEPLPYREFLGLVADARFVMTDSGGLQEETTFLDVACLTLRDNTERPVTISHGTNRLVGSSPQEILNAAHEAIAGRVQRRNGAPPLWDGQAAPRIVSTLREKLA